MIRKLTTLSLAAGALFLGACYEDEALSPPTPPAGSTLNALFDRPVWMGNSITAGFQSAGINDSTQRQSYATLLANAMGTPYFYRSLRGNGCVAPFTNNKTQARVGGASASACAGGATTELPWLSNVAVPGARSIEITNNANAGGSASNALTQIILQFATQAERMQEAQPTFVSLWIGNNDVLGALTNGANPGQPALVTAQGTFDAAYDAAAAQIDASTATGVLVVGVVDVSNIPYASKGATIWCLKTGACGFPAAAFPAAFTVNNNCAPNAAVPGSKGDSILVPWSKYLPMIGAAGPPSNTPTELNCATDAVVVNPTEYAALRNAVVGYNAKIQAVATANNWAFWDPNGALDSLRLAGQIPPFPNIATANVDFGPWISLDGVHPSATAHKLIANYMRGVINTKYATAIPAIP
jgi:phospholipase/lecithinase/hemolysin